MQLDWLYILLSFLLGIISTIIFLVSIFIIYVKPIRYVKPERSRLSKSNDNQSQDPHLSMSGWVRVSYTLLSASSAYKKFKFPKDAAVPEERGVISRMSSMVQSSVSYSSFLLTRFMGEQSAYKQKEPDVQVERFTDCYAVLQHKTLFLYTDDAKLECMRVFLVSNYTISLLPTDMSEFQYYSTGTPIFLRAHDEGRTPTEIYLYPLTQLEKETWFIILRRSSKLPILGDSEAMSTFYHDEEPMKRYTKALETLMENTKNDTSASVWLNAILGRWFVAVHANPNVKKWIMKRLSKLTNDRDAEDESILGDIEVKDVDFGNSLPMITNPKLLNMSINGDMEIQLDISYNGGIRVEAGTDATIEVPAWELYMKPIKVPIVLAVKIKRFSARILLKVKPFWESNRVWFGFFKEPELKLELDIEPIISNQLIKIQIVNEIIENRIKRALESHLMLPNMDDLAFWDFASLSGSPFDSTEFKHSMNQDAKIANDEFESALDAALQGEPQESKFKLLKANELNNSVSSFIDGIETSGAPNADQLPLPIPVNTPVVDPGQTDYISYLGDAAYSLGEFSRKHGIDNKVINIASAVKDYTEPAVSSAVQIVQDQAVTVGLTAIEKLGLKPKPSDESVFGSEGSHGAQYDSKKVQKKPSRAWSLMGVSISTSAPNRESVGTRPERKPMDDIAKHEAGDESSSASTDLGGENVRFRTVYKRSQ